MSKIKKKIKQKAKSLKKPVASKASAKAKSLKKSAVAKASTKAKDLKKSAVAKASTKAKSLKKPVASKASAKAKSLKKSAVAKASTKAKDLKKPAVAKKASVKAESLKKSSVSQNSVKKAEKMPKKKKVKSLLSSVNYREKELKVLLDKEKEKKLVLKDMEGRTYCLVENCDYPALVEDYCRIHFFGLFKMLKRKTQIIEQDILTKSYHSLIKKYTPAVFDYLLKDLSSEKDFKQAIKKFVIDETEDLELRDSFFE